jgi:DNA segregation ATPase FtsK/SpoIIIE, S-DNA-T family
MDRKRLRTVCIGVVLAALGVFFLMALATYGTTQGAMGDVVAARHGTNACGVVGALFGGWALWLLGWSAFVPAFCLLIAGCAVVMRARAEGRYVRAAAVPVVMFAAMLAFTFLKPHLPETWWQDYADPGGLLGAMFTRRVMGAIGTVGTLILMGILGVLGLYLLAGRELAYCAVLAWHAACRLLHLAKGKRRADVDTAGREAFPSASDGKATSKTVVVEMDTAPVAEDAQQEQPAPDEEKPARKRRKKPVKQEAPEQEVEDDVPEEAECEDDDDAAAAEVDEEPEAEPEPPPLEVVLHSAAAKNAEELPMAEDAAVLAPGEYVLPPVDILDRIELESEVTSEEQIRERGRLLQRTLSEFRVGAQVVRVSRGPVITMYELSLSPGTKVSKVEVLSDDLAIALRAPNVRIVAPLPGRNTIGIEVPNDEREIIGLRGLMAETRGKYDKMDIPMFMGKDTAGRPLLLDLAACPHLLVAGSTGSGKSVAINAIIASILMTRRPDEVQLLLIDPKSVEFAEFAQLPHLICPVVTDMKKAAAVLKWACKKMDDRYSVLSAAGVRNLKSYNKLGEDGIRKRLGVDEDADLDDVPFHMPHIIIVVDEFGELMMVAAKEVESCVIRLAQKARAVGIHLICATQRPSVDVITGLIKSNLPVRVAFQVASKVDSRTILDRNGAELLLGKGDMLLLPPGTSQIVRAQGAYIPDPDLHRLVKYLEGQSPPQFRSDLREHTTQAASVNPTDELYDEAVRVVLESQRGSVSLLQRRLAIGYSRAARLVDMMAEAGLVGAYKGSQARKVMITLEEWEAARGEGRS